MNNKVKMTQEGYDKLKAEYDELINVKKPQAIDRLKKAREMGDLSENSEYVAAKEDRSLVEGRIQEVEALLNNAEIVTIENSQSHIVDLGSVVKVKTDGVIESYTIVGEMEADPTQKKISNSSPIGKAIMGKQKGDIVEVEVPAGKRVFEVIEVI